MDGTQRSKCLGCQTSFDGNYQFPKESMCLEYKNYKLPLNDGKPKLILLKAITGFLNSKGGTLYIGVRDFEGTVEGVVMSRKEQDEMTRVILELTDRIEPRLDYNNREQVMIHFVPVLTGKYFEGRYLIKIIVKQGHPSQTYCISRKIMLEGPNRTEELEIVYGYIRHDSRVQELTGFKLIQQVQKKAASPSIVADNVHLGCNPLPKQLDFKVLRICFQQVYPRIQKLLQDIMERQLKKLDLTYNLNYREEEKKMFISFENEKDCVVARDFINQNLTNLNQAFQNNVYFVDRPNQANCFSYENKVKERILGQPPSGSTFVSPLFPSRKTPLLSNNMGQDSNNMAQHPNNMPNQEEYLLGTVPSGALTFYQNANYPSLSPSNFEKSPMGFYDKDVSQRSRIQSQRQVNKSMGVAQEQSAEQFALVCTNIDYDQIESLKQQLINIREDGTRLNFQEYQQSLNINFKSQKKMSKFYQIMKNNAIQLQIYGRNCQLFFGPNQGRLKIIHYDAKKRFQLPGYLKGLMKHEVKKISFEQQEPNKYFISCAMVSKSAACKWLDKLQVDQGLKEYWIPGSKQGNNPKIKIFLDCLPGNSK